MKSRRVSSSTASTAVFPAWRIYGCGMVSSRSDQRARATPSVPIWSCRPVIGSVIAYSDLYGRGYHPACKPGSAMAAWKGVAGRRARRVDGALWRKDALMPWDVWGPCQGRIGLTMINRSQ